MKKKIIYTASIILSVTLIYAIATGLYFSYMYRTILYSSEVDKYIEGYFYLFNIPGLLAVAVFMKNNYTPKRMLTAYSVSLLLTCACSFLIFLPLSKPLFTAILFLLFILMGCTQGCYVFLITLFVKKINRCIVLGIAASLSVLINYIFALFDDGLFVQSFSALPVYSIISVIACVYLYYIFKKLSYTEECPIENSTTDILAPATGLRFNRKAFWTTCIFIFLSWTIQSLAFYFPYNDSLVLGINQEALRITNVLGLLIGGYINSKDKKYGAISCLVILATPMLYILLQTQAQTTLIVFLLCYFFTGFLSIYRFGIISDMSESVDKNGTCLTYLCVFGLIFGRLGEGIGCLLGISLSSNTIMLITVASFVLVIATAFFIFHYIKLFIPIPQLLLNHEDIMSSFKARYNISNREMDVLEFLVDGASNTEIADKLFVSENTIRFHVRNILKKTNCKNRKELSALFHSQEETGR